MFVNGEKRLFLIKVSNHIGAEAFYVCGAEAFLCMWG